MNTEAASVEIFPERQNFSDGLGPMARWLRDQVLPETVDVIVQRVAEGERLKVICRSRGWPYSLVAAWVCGDEDVAKRYEQALRLAADEMAQSTIEIADEQAEVEKKDGTTYDPDVGRDKLRVETRLKVAGKLYRDRYGEQVQHNVVVDSFSEMLRRVSERRLKALRGEQTEAKVIDGEVLTAAPQSTAEEI